MTVEAPDITADAPEMQPLTMGEMPQEAVDFMQYMSAAMSSAYAFAGPIVQATEDVTVQQMLGEVMRYSELSTMYMERIVLAARMAKDKKEKQDGASS